MALEFPIITTLDTKGVNAADKAFKKLAGTFTAAFSTRAIINFTRESVKAFAESESAAKKLAIQLDSVNLGFASPYVRQFVEQASLATGIAERDLIPAFQKLSSVTGDVFKAQELLNLALDISLSTGANLQQTVSALNKAYVGSASSLEKLNIGITRLDTKGRSANEVLDLLQEKYGGKGQQAVDDFAGAWNRLDVAVGQAKIQFGKGLISGLNDSGVAIDQLQRDVIDLGDAFGYASGKALGFVSNLMDEVGAKILTGEDPINKFLRSLLEIDVSPKLGAAGAMKLAQANALALRKQQDEQKRLAALQKKNAADQLAAQQKQARLRQASALFDLERIQIEAALKGKITEEERTRLLLMKAILDENISKVEKLEAKLQDSIETQKTLAKSLDSFVANNPFVFWETYFDAQDKERKDLADSLGTFNANTPFTTWGSEWEAQADEQYKLNKKLGLFNANDPFKDWDAYFATQKDSISQVDKGLANLQKAAALTKIDAEGLAQAAADAWDKVFATTDKRTKDALTAMAKAAEDAAAAAEKKALAALEKLNAAQNVVPVNTSPNDKFAGVIPGFQPDPAPSQPILNSDLATLSTSSAAVTTLPLSGVGGATVPSSVPTTVVVNVAGTVTSETDLAQFIIDSVYKAQSNGIGISYKPTAI